MVIEIDKTVPQGQDMIDRDEKIMDMLNSGRSTGYVAQAFDLSPRRIKQIRLDNRLQDR